MFKFKRNKLGEKISRCKDGTKVIKRTYVDGTCITYYKFGPYEIVPIYDRHSSAPVATRYEVYDGDTPMGTTATLTMAKDTVTRFLKSFW